MYELRLLTSLSGELGQEFVRLAWTHPAWESLQRELSQSSESTAIIDNTTARNALVLMREGLGDQNSGYATLLPDLSVLVFAVTHFDRLLLLDHGLSEEDAKYLEQIFGRTIQRFNWAQAIRDDPTLAAELYRIFNSIQAQFTRPTLRGRWLDAWSKLLGTKEVDLVNFSTGDIDHLIRSPTQPLHPDLDPDAGELGGEWLGAVGGAPPRPSIYPRPLSALASYHTFRSVFYCCLSELLNFPYLPCGTRGVAMNFIPVECLKRDTDALNPKLYLALNSYPIRNQLEVSPPVVRVPVLRITPSLAVVMDKLQEIGAAPSWVEKWAYIVRDLRSESKDYRRHIHTFFQACCEDTFDYKKVVALGRALGGTGGAGLGTAVWSAVKIVGSVALAFVLHNPTLTVPALIELVTSRPWDLVRRGLERRKLSFILHARDLAASAFGVEPACKETWGRGFSQGEREYLERLRQVSAQ